MQQVIRPVKDYILATNLKSENVSALTDTTPLISGGILDSLSTLALVDFIEGHFGVQLEAHEAGPDRLDTLELIARVVPTKLAKV